MPVWRCACCLLPAACCLLYRGTEFSVDIAVFCPLAGLPRLLSPPCRLALPHRCHLQALYTTKVASSAWGGVGDRDGRQHASWTLYVGWWHGDIPLDAGGAFVWWGGVALDFIPI